MPLSKKFFRIIFFLLIISAGYILLYLAYNIFLNNLESKIIPEIAKEIGIDNLNLKISNAGLFGAEITSIHADANTFEAPSIDSVKIVYTPATLYKKHIKKIIIKGVQIYCEFNNGQINIRGFDLNRFISGISPKNSSAKSTKSFSLKSIELSNSNVTAYWKDCSINIPIDLKLVFDDKNKNMIDCLFNLYPRDNKIKVASKINQNTKKADIYCEAKHFSFERFSDFSNLVSGVNISGSADINSKLQIIFSPFKISSFACTVTADKLFASYNNIELTNPKEDVSGKKIPVILDIRNNEDDKWVFSATSFLLNSQLPVNISDLKCDITKSNESYNFKGDFHAFSGGNYPFYIKTNYIFNFFEKEKWDFNLSGKSIKRNNIKTALHINNFDILPKNLKFDLSGKGEDKKSYLKYNASVSGLKASDKKVFLKAPEVSIDGSLNIIESAASGFFNIKSNNINLMSETLISDIPVFSVSGNFNKNLKSAFKCNGKIQFNDVNLAETKSQIRVSGIKGKLPFKWPFDKAKSEGSVFAKKILWKNTNLGSFSGSIKQKDSCLIYTGQYTSIPFKEMNLNFSGKTDLLSTKNYETKIDFKTQKYKLSSTTDILRLFPQLKGLSFGGVMDLNGKLTFKEKNFKGSIKANIDEGSFKHKEKEILIEGIKIYLDLPHLPSVSSAPKQQLFFGKASIGSIQLSEGKVDFQIESAESFLIETCRFKWCDGSVNTNALRISTLNRNLGLTLFCDRINLAKLIEQFAIAKAEGNGAVNGKIPVEYDNGKLIFNDGFLYSTPGNGGIIHLAEAKILSQNMIPGTNQFAQIELTIEALKNYKYDWVKLKLSSAGEDLLLNLQFDGKPVNTLPFIYDKKAGGFTRVKSAAKGSNFQGIRLDINLTIPLDKVLHYKDAIKRH